MANRPDCHVQPDCWVQKTWFHDQLTLLTWPTHPIALANKDDFMANWPACFGQHTWLSRPTDLIVFANWPNCHGQLTWLSWPTDLIVMASLPSVWSFSFLSWSTCFRMESRSITILSRSVNDQSRCDLADSASSRINSNCVKKWSIWWMDE